MHIKQWDEELKAIANDLQGFAATLGMSKQEGFHAFEESKQELVSHDVLYSEVVEQTRQLSKRKLLGAPRLGALLHWVSDYVEKLDRYYQMQVKLLGKLLWLRLIHTRLAGTYEGGTALGDHDLVDMVTRRLNLQKTAQFLRQHLKNVRADKAALHDEYQKLQAFSANQTASRSMNTSLGMSYHEAAANPIIACMERFIGRLCGLNSVPREARRKITRTRRSIEQRSNILMSRCRNAVLGEMSSDAARAGATSDKYYEKCLEEVSLLENLLEQNQKNLSAASDYQRPVPMVKRPANRY